MATTDKLLSAIRNNPNDVKFKDLCRVCDHYFGEPRQQGSSHRIYKMPWQGDPMVNIQNKNGNAKPYQVKQALRAIDKLRSHS